jgi:hypothetical protein
MKALGNVAKLIEYLRSRSQPASVARIVADGVMTANEAYYALRCGIRNGVVERINGADGRPNEQARYRWTGRSLPLDKRVVRGHSFDALLAAWGMATVPPRIPRPTSLWSIEQTEEFWSTWQGRLRQKGAPGFAAERLGSLEDREARKGSKLIYRRVDKY